MFDLQSIMAMLPLEKLANQIKPELPKYMEQLVLLLAMENGAGPDERTGTMLFRAQRADGTATTMATTYRLNERDEPAEVVGTLDVVATVNRLDLSALIRQAR